MKTIESIREDLSEIRYYYSMKDLFDTGAEIVSPSYLIKKVEEYSNAISQSPAQLYALYIALYVNNEKQISVASEWGYTTYHVKWLNRRLCEYFQQVLD